MMDLKTFTHFLAAGVLTWACAVLPATAASSDWAQSEGGRMRMITIEGAEKGRLKAILEIVPLPGWKTYWRDPGEAGMPPQFDFTGTQNLKPLDTAFPVPIIGLDEGHRFIGYDGTARLILDFERADPAASSLLKADVMIGLCKEICLPFQASFALEPAQGHDTGTEQLALTLAEAALPEKPSADFGITEQNFAPDRSAIDIAIALPGSTPPEIALLASPGLRLGMPDITVEGHIGHVRIPVKKMPKTLEGMSLTILVKSAGRAMEAALALK